MEQDQVAKLRELLQMRQDVMKVLSENDEKDSKEEE